MSLTAPSVAKSHYNYVVQGVDDRVLAASTIHRVGGPREVKCPCAVDPELTAIYYRQRTSGGKKRKFGQFSSMTQRNRRMIR